MRRFLYDFYPLFLGIIVGAFLGNALGNIVVYYAQHH